MRHVLAAVLGALIAIAYFLVGALLHQAFAHDAQHAGMTGAWIGERRLSDPKTKLSCCGNLDCRPLPDNALLENGLGYSIIPTREWIPHERVIRTPTEDGGAWRCEFTSDISFGGDGPAAGQHKRGSTRCLILPPPGM